MKSPIVASILLLSAVQAGHAQVIAAWNFEAPNDTIMVNNTPAPSSGTGTADAIGMTNTYNGTTSTNTDDVLLGVAGDTGKNNVADTTQVWRVRGQSPGNGWSNMAPIATQGAQFFTPTTGVTSATATGIKVTFDWYSTTQGEANLALEYTTNGTTWIEVPLTLGGSDTGLVVDTNSTSGNTIMGSYVSDNLLKNGSSAGQDWFTGLTATITDPAALNDPNFAVEMVNASTGADDLSTQGTALNNTSGNWRFDNVSIQAVDAPESGTWALMVGSLGLLAAVLRFRKGQLIS